MPSQETKNLPLTQGLTGWVQFTSGGPGEGSHLEKPICSLGTREVLHHAHSLNSGCASTTPICQDPNKITGIIVGTPCWADHDTQAVSRLKGNAAALVYAYTKFGDSFANGLSGNFAFALLDSRQEVVILSTDRLGRYPLYYQFDNDILYFGTSASSVTHLIGKSGTIQPQGIYNYVYFHMIPSPSSVYEGLHKLHAGSQARLCKGKILENRYWHPQFKESTNATAQELYLELKAQLNKAVRAAIPKHGKVGAFLSGGLDSSTVTGMLAEASEQPCDAYSIGFAAEGYDEMEYARITANHFGARLHEYYVTPDDVVAALPLIASSYDEPFGNSSALPAYFCARMAADDGVTLLLAGDGGDEVFAGNERYAQQRIFEAYKHIPRLLRRGLIEPLAKHIPGWMPLAEKSRSYIAQANTPLPDRLQTYNFLHRYQASEIFQHDFLRHIDIESPLELQREIYNAPNSATSLNRMLFLDWQYTLADNDLRKVSHMCAVAGINVAYPMLDDALINFSLSIPSQIKLPGAKLRDFYKSALTGWLPDATISKKKQGFGLPFGVGMATHTPLQELAYDSIVKLKSRNIFNPTFLDKAIQLHKTGHAAYFGELIWVLTVLELWLDANS